MPFKQWRLRGNNPVETNIHRNTYESLRIDSAKKTNEFQLLTRQAILTIISNVFINKFWHSVNTDCFLTWRDLLHFHQTVISHIYFKNRKRKKITLVPCYRHEF